MKTDTVGQHRKAFHPWQIRIYDISQRTSRISSIAGFYLDGTNNNSDANCLFGASHAILLRRINPS
jgi:hypothetical protein